MHPGSSPLYVPNPTPNNSIVGRVEHLLNQTEHILSRTESLDSNSHSAGLQRLLSHKEQLEHVERLLAQAEYAIWLEKRTAQQASESTSYGYTHTPNGALMIQPGFPSGNSSNSIQCKDTSPPLPAPNNGMVVNNHGNSNSNSVKNNGSNSNNHNSRKTAKNLEEESVV